MVGVGHQDAIVEYIVDAIIIIIGITGIASAVAIGVPLVDIGHREAIVTAIGVDAFALGPPPMDCLDGGDREGARFNVALALVTMYVGCTLTNWGTWEAKAGGSRAPLAGFVSMWLNMAAQWCLFLLYEWSLVAALFFPDRDFA